MNPREPLRWYEWLLLATLVVIGISVSCAYHACINDNWKCGLPGVHCRKIQ